jgi:hypothetical protein
MGDAWQILRAGGLPLATAGTSSTPSAAELAAAARAAIASEPSGREADALAAFVLAWRHHWPASFATELGDGAAPTIEWATRQIDDAGRYLKLRRIAVENLATVL